jgi:hypothetical protein
MNLEQQKERILACQNKRKKEKNTDTETVKKQRLSPTKSKQITSPSDIESSPVDSYDAMNDSIWNDIVSYLTANPIESYHIIPEAIIPAIANVFHQKALMITSSLTALDIANTDIDSSLVNDLNKQLKLIQKNEKLSQTKTKTKSVESVEQHKTITIDQMNQYRCSCQYEIVKRLWFYLCRYSLRIRRCLAQSQILLLKSLEIWKSAPQGLLEALLTYDNGIDSIPILDPRRPNTVVGTSQAAMIVDLTVDDEYLSQDRTHSKKSYCLFNEDVILWMSNTCRLCFDKMPWLANYEEDTFEDDIEDMDHFSTKGSPFLLPSEDEDLNASNVTASEEEHDGFQYHMNANCFIGGRVRLIMDEETKAWEDGTVIAYAPPYCPENDEDDEECALWKVFLDPKNSNVDNHLLKPFAGNASSKETEFLSIQESFFRAYQKKVLRFTSNEMMSVRVEDLEEDELIAALQRSLTVYTATTVTRT